MPPRSRWKDSTENTARAACVANDVCAQCHGRVTDTELLTVDRDGSSYCRKCWKAYYGRAPPARIDSREAGRSLAKNTAAADSSEVVENGPHASGYVDLVTLVPNTQEPDRDVAMTGSSEACSSTAPALDSDDRLCAQDRMTTEPLDANLCDVFSKAVVEADRFEVAVAELRSRYFAERTDEVESQQREELEILVAIYGESLDIISNLDNAGEHAGPIVFRLELPGSSEGEGGRTALFVSTTEGEIPAGIVEALPPLALRCALPSRYPDAEMPVFSVEAEYLSANDIGKIEAELRSLADEQVGEPVLFAWASALQERPSLERLVIQDGEDGFSDPMTVVLQLLAHDQSVRDERRLHKSQTCPVCFDELMGSRGVFLGCGHFACRECLDHMVKLHTGEADIGALRCPETDCREPFSFSTLTEVLGSDSPELARWEELSLQKCLDTMKDVVFCPRCDTDADSARVPCIEDEDRMAQCGVCGFVFCGRCRDVFHPGVSCAATDDKMEALEARAQGRGPAAEKARAELATMRHLVNTTKNCPCCTLVIEKSEGCNKMCCRQCKTYFCWKCGKEIEGYDHFATTECRLFDDDEIKRWNTRMQTVNRADARAHEARFLAQFVNPGTMWQQARTCPRCKANVIREGKNNHLRCHACQTHFCAQCTTVLPKNNVMEHFNSKKGACPQHSD